MLSSSFYDQIAGLAGWGKELINPSAKGVPDTDLCLDPLLCSRNWRSANGKTRVPDTHRRTGAPQRPLEEWRCCPRLEDTLYLPPALIPWPHYPALLLSSFQSCGYCSSLLKSVHRFGSAFRALSLMHYGKEKAFISICEVSVGIPSENWKMNLTCIFSYDCHILIPYRKENPSFPFECITEPVQYTHALLSPTLWESVLGHWWNHCVRISTSWRSWCWALSGAGKEHSGSHGRVCGSPGACYSLSLSFL